MCTFAVSGGKAAEGREDSKEGGCRVELDDWATAAARERVIRVGGAVSDVAGADDSLRAPELVKLPWLGLRSIAGVDPPKTAVKICSCTRFDTSIFAIAFLRSAFAAELTEGWVKTAMQVCRASERTVESESERSGKRRGVKGRSGGSGRLDSGAGHRMAARKCKACGKKHQTARGCGSRKRQTRLLPRLRILALKAILLHASLNELPRAFLVLRSACTSCDAQSQTRLSRADHALAGQFASRGLRIAELVEREKKGEDAFERVRERIHGRGGRTGRVKVGGHEQGEQGWKTGEGGIRDVRVVRLERLPDKLGELFRFCDLFEREVRSARQTLGRDGQGLAHLFGMTELLS